MKQLRHLIGWGLLLPALAITQAHAQSDALLIKRPTELREAPAEAARSLAPLAVQTAITRLPARQGAWIQVRTAAGTTGWVHMFDVGTTAAPAMGVYAHNIHVKPPVTVTAMSESDRRKWIDQLPALSQEWVKNNEARGVQARALLAQYIAAVKARGAKPERDWER